MSEDGKFTPFFVADRQASLRIILGLTIPEGKKIGLMTHANTFSPFKKAFKEYPCFEPQACILNDGKPCPFNQNLLLCSKGSKVRESTIKICDSGAFQKKGCDEFNYHDLFDKYEEAGTDYGIIMDFLKDSKKTLKSAQEAIDLHNAEKRNFKLIGVAQGVTLKEYVRCYKKLKKVGYEHVAIGGMLQRRVNSARYVTVKDETLLKEVLSEIRRFDKDGWLFALGCYSPKRHSIFLENSVFGADYKGWIFQYKGSSPKRGNKKSQSSRFRQVREFIDNNILSAPQEWGHKSKLLIVECSSRKKMTKGRSQAINLYDGPMFRMLRKRVHNFSNEDGLDIMIVSAKYGLIPPKKSISYYDQKMTPENAMKQQQKNLEIIKELTAKKNYTSILVTLSSAYLLALEPALTELSDNDVKIVKDRIGTKLNKTRLWLNS